MHFTWDVLMDASINEWVRKNLEESFIALNRPSLNKQIGSKKPLLFQKGVTWKSVTW